ncbi:HAD-IA family hydrolase [Hyphomonas sp.]|jgi:phosphoglycolate phosphatase|uniref:HAD-IA family hydrolase n=1 Tax=Hyphomonas sp. TaxID=87 RepID=UPI0032D96590
MSGLKLAIWDVDGTLVDSRTSIHEIMVEAFTLSALTPPEYDATRRIVGLSLHEACGQLAPEVTAAEIDRLVNNYRDCWVRARARPDFTQPLYDGALETLEMLRSEGWLIAMATGKTHKGIRSLFDAHAIEPFFDTVWCADDGPGKPHPHMVEQAMGALGCAPHESLMIGDAIHDISMGRAAGVYTHGVSWGFGAAHELEEVGAHEIHHEFDTLQKSLLAFEPAL